jgi:hypothetical protein
MDRDDGMSSIDAPVASQPRRRTWKPSPDEWTIKAPASPDSGPRSWIEKANHPEREYLTRCRGIVTMEPLRGQHPDGQLPNLHSYTVGEHHNLPGSSRAPSVLNGNNNTIFAEQDGSSAWGHSRSHQECPFQDEGPGCSLPSGGTSQ